MRMDEGDAFKFRDDVVELGLVRFEEFSSGGYVVEKIFDREDTSGFAGFGLD